MSKFILKVDNRENALLLKLRSLNPLLTIQSAQLPIGDIIISNEKEDIIIIERKTIHDLQSSIRDGRYEEQSYRLNGLPHHNHNIIYLIEGDINNLNKFVKVDKSALYSAMFSLNYYKGFSLFRSTSLDETATIICNILCKLEKETEKGSRVAFYTNSVEEELNKEPSSNAIENQSDKTYVSFAKKIKKDNITQENIGEIMLCQIPGISSITALAIIAKFKSISNLIKEITLNPDCLKDISYITTKGQNRKINATSINNIIKYLQ